jgi:hypothetical protein
VGAPAKTPTYPGNLRAEPPAVRGDALTAARPSSVEAPTTAGAVDGSGPATGALVRAAAHAARSSIGPLTESARRAAQSFRYGDFPAAHHELTQTVSTLRTLALVTGMLTVTPGIDAGQKASADPLLPCLSSSLDQLTACRQQLDWDGVAQVLERDIPALLCEWSAVLAAIHEAASESPTRSWLSASADCPLVPLSAASEVQ